MFELDLDDCTRNYHHNPPTSYQNNSLLEPWGRHEVSKKEPLMKYQKSEKKEVIYRRAGT